MQKLIEMRLVKINKMLWTWKKHIKLLKKEVIDSKLKWSAMWWKGGGKGFWNLGLMNTYGMCSMWTMSVCGKKNQLEKERKRGILSSFRLRSAKSQIKGKKKNSGVLYMFMQEPIIVESSLRNHWWIMDRFITSVIGDFRPQNDKIWETSPIEIVAWDVSFPTNPTSLN